MLQLAGLALVGALLAVAVKRNNSEYGYLLSLAVTAAILFVALAALRPVIDFITELAAAAGLDDSIFSPLLKAVGIAILTHITAELCRDAKESGIAAGVELGGAILILFTSVPLFSAVLQLMKSLL